MPMTLVFWVYTGDSIVSYIQFIMAPPNHVLVGQIDPDIDSVDDATDTPEINLQKLQLSW